MKKIDTPPSHPERWPYITHNDPQCGWLCIPTSGQVQDALIGATDLIGAAKVEYQLGAVVLLAWTSHTHELEASTPRGVYQELHLAGWRDDRITALAARITASFADAHTSEDEVKEAEDFSEGTQPTG